MVLIDVGVEGDIKELRVKDAQVPWVAIEHIPLH
jgi:hypothetical protein